MRTSIDVVCLLPFLCKTQNGIFGHVQHLPSVVVLLHHKVSHSKFYKDPDTDILYSDVIRLQNAIKYCTKVCKTSSAGQIVD